MQPTSRCLGSRPRRIRCRCLPTRPHGSPWRGSRPNSPTQTRRFLTRKYQPTSVHAIESEARNIAEERKSPKPHLSVISRELGTCRRVFTGERWTLSGSSLPTCSSSVVANPLLLQLTYFHSYVVGLRRPHYIDITVSRLYKLISALSKNVGTEFWLNA